MKKYILLSLSLFAFCPASAMLRTCARMLPKAWHTKRSPHSDAIDPDLRHAAAQEEAALRMQILKTTTQINSLEEQTQILDPLSHVAVLAINPSLCYLDYIHQLPGGSYIAGTLITAVIAGNVCIAHKTRAALWRLKHLKSELFWVQKCGAFEKQLKRDGA